MYNFGDLDLPVSNYGRKKDFTGANLMTSFPAKAHQKSKCTQAHFVERTLKYQKQLLKQGASVQKCRTLLHCQVRLDSIERIPPSFKWIVSVCFLSQYSALQ